VNSPPSTPEVILTNFFAEPTVLLVPITSRDSDRSPLEEQFCVFKIILKMAIGRNLPMSGINSGYHNLPTNQMSLKSDNVEFVRYCGGHFEKGDR
jgi:hypothetical protein